MTAKFWERNALKYSRRQVANESAYQKKLEVTASYFKSDMRIWEFGCGTGTTALHHAPKVEYILATDIAAGMLKIAKEKAELAGVKNVEFQCSAVEELHLLPESFDMVMAHSILHLVKDKEAVLAKVYDALKPGGYLVSSTVCMGDIMNWFKYIAPVGKAIGLLPIVEIFTEKELFHSLKTAGFRIDYEWKAGEKSAIFIVAQK